MEEYEKLIEMYGRRSRDWKHSELIVPDLLKTEISQCDYITDSTTADRGYYVALYGLLAHAKNAVYTSQPWKLREVALF